ncbi:MAG: hypothetical protein HZC55_11775 [Verrucomicrobia bacterium]|nr:hypothetical protein [Verrucomicrobiota bacterium]
MAMVAAAARGREPATRQPAAKDMGPGEDTTNLAPGARSAVRRGDPAVVEGTGMVAAKADGADIAVRGGGMNARSSTRLSITRAAGT